MALISGALKVRVTPSYLLTELLYLSPYVSLFLFMSLYQYLLFALVTYDGYQGLDNKRVRGLAQPTNPLPLDGQQKPGREGIDRLKQQQK